MRTHLELRRIGLWSLFKVAFLLYAAIGLAVGLCYGFVVFVASGFGIFLADELPEFGFWGGFLGLFLIPVLALFYGALGSAFVTLGGLVFNVVAGMAGGLQIEAVVTGPVPRPGTPVDAPEPPDGAATGPAGSE